ncbi:MAG: M20/M25/M40 family metallo-hydrolase [Phycisphaerales bacterium]
MSRRGAVRAWVGGREEGRWRRCSSRRRGIARGVAARRHRGGGRRRTTRRARGFVRMRPDACIIGRPSGWDGVTMGYKGVVAGAGSRPCAQRARRRRPATMSTRGGARVLGAVDTFNAGREGAFERVQARILGAGTTSDGVEERAWIEGGFRIPVDVTPEDVRTLTHRAAGGAVEVTQHGGERAVRSDRNDPVVRALAGGVRGEGGHPRVKVKTGTADFNVVAPVWRCPIAAYGPGDSSLDHTADEHLVLEEYLRSIRVLVRAIEALATELTGGAA